MPANSFARRLDLLESSSQLSQETRRRIELLVQRVETEFDLELTEDRGAMFVTHVAIAWEKLRRGETLPPAPDNLLDEVRGHVRERDFLAKSFADLDDSVATIPDGELAFWTAHLVAVQHGS
jgi:hypothetical protein